MRNWALSGVSTPWYLGTAQVCACTPNYQQARLPLYRQEFGSKRRFA